MEVGGQCHDKIDALQITITSLPTILKVFFEMKLTTGGSARKEAFRRHGQVYI